MVFALLWMVNNIDALDYNGHIAQIRHNILTLDYEYDTIIAVKTE